MKTLPSGKQGILFRIELLKERDWVCLDFEFSYVVILELMLEMSSRTKTSDDSLDNEVEIELLALVCPGVVGHPLHLLLQTLSHLTLALNWLLFAPPHTTLEEDDKKSNEGDFKEFCGRQKSRFIPPFGAGDRLNY